MRSLGELHLTLELWVEVDLQAGLLLALGALSRLLRLIETRLGLVYDDARPLVHGSSGVAGVLLGAEQ